MPEVRPDVPNVGSSKANVATQYLRRYGVSCHTLMLILIPVFRIRKIFYGSGSSDPYPDFTDPDPTHLMIGAGSGKSAINGPKGSDPDNGEYLTSK
jgi:hypothetical protein